MIRYGKAFTRTFTNVFSHKQVWKGCAIAAIPLFAVLLAQLLVLQNALTFLGEELGKLVTVMQEASYTQAELTAFGKEVLLECWTLYQNDFICVLALSFFQTFVVMVCHYRVAYSVNKVEQKTEESAKEALTTLARGFVLILWVSVRVFLWSLLLIVPGIIKSYAYAMSLSIFVEDPSKKINDCVKESEKLMKGRKERLFLTELLVALVVGAGVSVVTSITSVFEAIPYVGVVFSAAITAFATMLQNAFTYATYAVYYVEIKKDEEFLAKYPHLREMGINGVMEEVVVQQPIVFFDAYGRRCYRDVDGQVRYDNPAPMPTSPFEDEYKYNSQPQQAEQPVGEQETNFQAETEGKTEQEGEEKSE